MGLDSIMNGTPNARNECLAEMGEAAELQTTARFNFGQKLDDYDAFARHAWYQKMIADGVARLPELLPNSHIIVAGCGTGMDIAQIQSRYAGTIEITGVDISDRMLGTAQSKFLGDTNICIQKGDVRSMRAQKPVHAMMSANMIHYLDANGKKDFAKSAASILPELGTLVVSTGFYKGAKNRHMEEFNKILGSELIAAIQTQFPNQLGAAIQGMKRRDPDLQGYAQIFRDAGFDVQCEEVEYMIPYESSVAFFTSEEALDAMMPGIPLPNARDIVTHALAKARSIASDPQASHRKWLFLTGKKL